MERKKIESIVQSIMIQVASCDGSKKELNLVLESGIEKIKQLLSSVTEITDDWDDEKINDYVNQFSHWPIMTKNIYFAGMKCMREQMRGVKPSLDKKELENKITKFFNEQKLDLLSFIVDEGNNRLVSNILYDFYKFLLSDKK